MWFKDKFNWSNDHNFSSGQCVQLAIAVILIVVSFASADEVDEVSLPAELSGPLVVKDNNTLLKRDFISQFLKGCPEKPAEPKQFCTMYYDLVFNIYNKTSKSDEIKMLFDKAIKESANPTTADFCDTFPSDVGKALVEQPFSLNNKLNVTEWIQTKGLCFLTCFNVIPQMQPTKLKMNPACKVISVGCQWIIGHKDKPVLGGSKSTSIETAGQNTASKETPKQTPDQHQQPVNPMPNTPSSPSVMNVSSPNNSDTKSAKEQSSTSSKIENKVPQKVPDITPNLDKPDQTKTGTNVKNPQSSTPTEASGKSNNKKDDKMAPPPPPQPNDPNIDDPISDDNTYNGKDDPDSDTNEGDARADDEDVFQEDSKINSNLQSQSAQQSGPRDSREEDNQSNFFPLLMFLMFVVVSFYVAYHNKSKILALLIEGRRRNSTRGGSRRKQHSAEYRKLDSNLEEAIQSDGGHVLSTQIIY